MGIKFEVQKCFPDPPPFYHKLEIICVHNKLKNLNTEYVYLT